MRANQHLNKKNIFCKASSGQRLFGGIFLIGIIVFFVFLWMAGRYEITLWPYYCGFKQQYDLPCPGCGMTTSVLAFGQGRIFESFYIQPAAGLFCSILAISGFFAFFTAVFGVYFRFLKRAFSELKPGFLFLLVLVIILAGWAVTLARAFAER